MESIGYGLSDLLPAYPGNDVAYIDQVFRDNACALSRSVISYGMLGIHPSRTKFFNMTAHGYRWIGEDQPWPLDARYRNVFFFGGSTALGYNVEDRHTVPSILHRILTATDVPTQVYNFGCGNYSSRHEALRFLDLLDRGHVPDVAVFLDGWNDSYYAYGYLALVNALDGFYQSEKRRRRMSYLFSVLDYAMESLRERRHPLPSAVTERPSTMDPDIANLISPAGIIQALADTAAPATLDALPPGQQRIAETVWDRWQDSNSIIRVLAERHNVKTLFVWQPVPLFATSPAARVAERLFGAFPNSVLCSAVYKWLHVRSFPNLPKDINFIDLSRLGAESREVCYVDICHYNESFSKIIAENMARALMPVIAEVK